MVLGAPRVELENFFSFLTGKVSSYIIVRVVKLGKQQRSSIVMGRSCLIW